MIAQPPPEEFLRGLQQAAETDAFNDSDSASDEEIVARLRASGPNLSEVRNRNAPKAPDPTVTAT